MIEPEVPPTPPRPIRLTDLTDCGGCAAKLGADLLAEALAGLGATPAPPELIAGLTPPDDAAAYRLSDDLAVIGTLDFFPPLVDDPATFGAIAAANACSDVFAMGGRVLFALSIAAFPEELPRGRHWPRSFEGAAAMVREAGGVAGRRPHDPRPGAEVRAGGGRRGPPRPAAAQGRRAAGRRAAAHQAARDRVARVGRSPGADVGRQTSTAAIAQMRTAQPRGRGGARRGAASAARPTSPASGCSATGWRWRGRRGRGSSSSRRRSRRCPARWTWRAAGVETGGAAHNRRFVAPALDGGRTVAPGADRAGPRPADLGWAPGAPCRPTRCRPWRMRCTQPASPRGASAGSRPPGCRALRSSEVTLAQTGGFSPAHRG